MSKGKFPIGDAKARRAAKKAHKTQKLAARKAGPKKKIPSGAGSR